MISLGAAYRIALLHGAWATAWIALATMAVGTALGVLLALAAKTSKLAELLLKPIIYVLMALPALVLLVWIFYALPLIDRRLALNPEITAITALGLSLAAFIADIIINGIKKMPRGQLEVARVLFGSRYPTVRYILLPHGLRLMGIPILGQYITTLKFTTLASVIGVAELLQVGGDIIQRTYRPIEVYTIIAAAFVVLILPFNLMLRLCERRLFPETRI